MKEIYIIFRMNRPMDTIQEIWDSNESAELRCNQLYEERPSSDGFYFESWKLNTSSLHDSPKNFLIKIIKTRYKRAIRIKG